MQFECRHDDLPSSLGAYQIEAPKYCQSQGSFQGKKHPLLCVRIHETKPLRNDKKQEKNVP